VKSFDEELEAEVERMMNPGDDTRRQIAVRDLHMGSQYSVVLRVAGVALAIATVVIVFHFVGTALALQALGDLCRAVAVCG
jgi:hypothetical protein